MHTTAASLALSAQIVREIYEEAKKYEHVLDLTLGDPDIPTPAAILRKTEEALASNQTKYTANSGMPTLRRAIAEDVRRYTGVSYDPDSEITVTAGAMGALYLTTVSILEPGDEMLILEPNWPNYLNMVKMCRATPVTVSLFSDDVMRDLRAALTPRTRAIILNTPSNPTGHILPFSLLQEIADFAKKHDLYVISDEVYRTIVFREGFSSILTIDGMRERTILIDSLSKRFCMTGFRVGSLCAPREIAHLTAQLQENVNSCACMFAQLAAAEALTHGGEEERRICAIFRERCFAMADVLRRSPYLKLPVPEATFYLFVDIRETGLSSTDFALRLLREKHIAAVPGNAFGAAGEGYLRIACTLPRETLVSAAETIVAFADSLVK